MMGRDMKVSSPDDKLYKAQTGYQKHTPRNTTHTYIQREMESGTKASQLSNVI